MTATLESLNLPSSITPEKATVEFGPYATGTSLFSVYSCSYDVLTTPVDMSNSVSINDLKNRLSEGTYEIHPYVHFYTICDNNTHIAYSIDSVIDTDHKITIEV